MRLALLGQPNCGKSTIFNAVAGYRSATANFPGTSLSFLSSNVLIQGQAVEIIDLPGAYSLLSQEEVQRRTAQFLEEQEVDVFVNVVDASRLGRSLELTLQLLDLGRPMVLALNMMDEAQRKGIEIDTARLSGELGIPVIPTNARHGVGLSELFTTALKIGHDKTAPIPRPLDNEIEQSVSHILPLLKTCPCGRSCRAQALMVLERAPGALQSATLPDSEREAEETVRRLEKLHGWPGDQVVSGARHALAHLIEDKVSHRPRSKPSRRDRLDQALMHPVLGIPILLGILALLFFFVFGVGKHIEGPLSAFFEGLASRVAVWAPPDTTGGAILNGAITGFSGGLGIVLPYLLPFLVALAALDDTGYLPRMAYLLDGLMHRIGLHGESVVPLMLGFGCSVPAVMATRILESPRDRRITATLSVLVPCSARTMVILGLVGALLGFGTALIVYAVNLAVILLLGVLMQRSTASRPLGMVLEVPDLRLPSLRAVAARTWVALREFLVVAWPALIASSVVLGLLEISRLDAAVNALLSPVTVTILGLPMAVGLTLVFGVMRKELALMMLIQALGTSDLRRVLTPAQMISFALFTTFYVPCVATLAALWKEIGWKETARVVGITFAIALVVAWLGRVATGLFWSGLLP